MQVAVDRTSTRCLPVFVVLLVASHVSLEGPIARGQAVAVASQPAEVMLVGLEPQRWSVRRIDEQGRVVFLDAAANLRRIAPSRLVYWGAYVDRDSGVQVILADGGVVCADYVQADAERLTVDSQVFGEVTLPLEQVAGVVFQPPADPLSRDRLIAELKQAQGNDDQLLLDNGDRLRGVLVSPPERGAEGDERSNEEALWLSLQGKAPRAIPLERLAAVTFNPALREVQDRSDGTLQIGLGDGSLLNVSEVAWIGRDVSLRLRGRVSLTTDETTLLEQLQWMQSLRPKVDYVSDVAGAVYRHIPFLALPWDYHRDRNVLGGRLRSGASVWRKGVGMHSTARLVVNVPKGRDRFRAELALDRAAGKRGSVGYRVFANGRDGEWKPIYRSRVIRGGDRPVAISLDITGAQRLALIVDFADRGDERDHANWLNARFE